MITKNVMYYTREVFEKCFGSFDSVLKKNIHEYNYIIIIIIYRVYEKNNWLK